MSVVSCATTVDHELASREQIMLTVQAVRKTHGRNKKKRKKVFTEVAGYLDDIIPALYEEHKKHLIGDLVEWMDEITDLFLEAIRLLIPLLDGSEIMKDETSRFSNTLESFLLHVRQWCESQETGQDPTSCFVDLTTNLLTGILQLVADAESWYYVDIINSPVTYIFLQWVEVESLAADKLLSWTNSVANLVNIFEKRIDECGDFACQYFLILLIQQWLTWVESETAENYLQSVFHCVNLDFRRLLLGNLDFDYGGRQFLNAINSSSNRGPRAGVIISVQCLYFFAGGQRLKPPEGSDQLWIDFSTSSGRIHCFFSISSNHWINLNIESGHVDSICVSWLRKSNGTSQIAQSAAQQLAQDSTQMSTVSDLDVCCLIFLHIQLKQNFSEINDDLVNAFHEEDTRSLTLVFEDFGKIENVLQQMCFPTHSNGDQCIRPPQLNRLISKGDNLDLNKTMESIMEDQLVSARDTLDLNTTMESIMEDQMASARDNLDLNKTMESIVEDQLVSVRDNLDLNKTMESIMEDQLASGKDNLDLNKTLESISEDHLVRPGDNLDLNMTIDSIIDVEDQLFSPGDNLDLNMTMDSIMEDPFPRAVRNKLVEPRTVVESRPVPKVWGRTPCYAKYKPIPPSLSQLGDPYDITKDDFFRKEKKKTYSRKRKSKVVRIPKKSLARIPLINKSSNIGLELDANKENKKIQPSRKQTPLTIKRTPSQPSLLDKTFDWDNIDIDLDTDSDHESLIPRNVNPLVPRDIVHENKVLESNAHKSLDDTFDWDNIDIDHESLSPRNVNPLVPRDIVDENKVLESNAHKSLDDTFDWDNIDLDF